MDNLILFGIISILIFLAPLINSSTKLPIVVVEILLGAFAINIGMLVESDVIKEVAHIGFLFLMFLAGVEVDIKSFKTLGKAFIQRVAIYFCMLYLAAIIIVLVCDLSVIYVAAFPVMSLGMIMVLIQDYGKDHNWLDLCLKIGIIGELISILMLVLLNGYYSFGMGIGLYKSLFSVLVFLLLIAIIFKIAGIVFWWFPQLRLILIPDKGTMNQDMRYSMMLFFVMVVIVSLLRIEAALGAFLSGLVLSQFFKYKKGLHQKLNDFGFGFLIPLFFVYIGTTLDFKTIISSSEIIYNAIYICIAMLGIRLLAASIAFWTFFKSIKHTVLFALSGAMPLTFLVATATLGLNIGAIDKAHYCSFVLAAILESMAFIIIIKIIINGISTFKGINKEK